ncbi:MAG: hypothetical protein ACRC7N_10070 [Clostridium sp.]
MINMKQMIKEITESFNDEKIFFNKLTEEFTVIDEYYLCIAEGRAAKKLILPWQKEIVNQGIVIIESPKDYIECPSKKDINENELMYRFISEKLFDEEKNDILQIIEGRNTLSRFKSAIEGMYYESLWDIFIYEEIEKLCKGWCFKNNISYY